VQHLLVGLGIQDRQVEEPQQLRHRLGVSGLVGSPEAEGAPLATATPETACVGPNMPVSGPPDQAIVEPLERGSYHAVMDMPAEAQQRISHDSVAWLTTVTDRGAPAPNPVWFVPDGDDLVIFSAPDARKVHNIEQRPTVTLHFNSDASGGDVVVITGQAAVARDKRPSALEAYLDKYEADITGPLATTVDAIDRTYNTEIRVRPTRVRLTDTSG
jgi:PPOX class probable F420-dependent enzyme